MVAGGEDEVLVQIHPQLLGGVPVPSRPYAHYSVCYFSASSSLKWACAAHGCAGLGSDHPAVAAATVAAAVCAASLRMQSDPANKDFKGISPERAYADYVLAGMVLFAAAWNYIG